MLTIGGLVGRYAVIPGLLGALLLILGKPVDQHVVALMLGVGAMLVAAGGEWALLEAARQERALRDEAAAGAERQSLAELDKRLADLDKKLDGLTGTVQTAATTANETFQRVIGDHVQQMQTWGESTDERTQQHLKMHSELVTHLQQVLNNLNRRYTNEDETRRRLQAELEAVSEGLKTQVEATLGMMKQIPGEVSRTLAPIQQLRESEMNAYQEALADHRQAQEKSNKELESLWTKLLKRLDSKGAT
jgi:chromosome segregation ATPase